MKPKKIFFFLLIAGILSIILVNAMSLAFLVADNPSVQIYTYSEEETAVIVNEVNESIPWLLEHWFGINHTYENVTVGTPHPIYPESGGDPAYWIVQLFHESSPIATIQLHCNRTHATRFGWGQTNQIFPNPTILTLYQDKANSFKPHPFIVDATPILITEEWTPYTYRILITDIAGYSYILDIPLEP